MFRGILPKEVVFYDYFEKLAALNLSISKLFLKMIEGQKNLIESSHEIKKLESEAERLTRTSVDLIHHTFITPFDRDDIYRLLKGMDNFSDDIFAATFRLTHYEISDMRPEAIDFAQIIHDCAIEIEIAVKGLRKIKKKDGIMKSCTKVHELEFRSDEILRNALASLYHQDDVHLLLKWKEIFERLERSVDRMEKVASIIEGILIDNS
jgi:uncharacterized protein Yka (UPF0111/DUF47 family)